MKWVITEELGRISRLESELHRDFDRLIVTSEKDRELIAGANVHVLPLGVDLETFCPVTLPKKSRSIVFSGNMSYAPNIDAARWFVKECLPLIRAEMPDASLTIVGANPSKQVRDLGKTKGVVVQGFVESMNHALNTARVAVAPMQSGSGMQFKVLEAMACGIPVVATSLGLGVIKALPGVGVQIGDTAEAFALQVKNLLRQPELACDIGRRGREFVLHNHNWSVAADQIESMYEHVCRHPQALLPERALQVKVYNGRDKVSPVLKY